MEDEIKLNNTNDKTPDLSDQEIDLESQPSSGPNPKTDSNRTSVYHGEALAIDELQELMRDQRHRTIVLCGGVDTGKTTILSELFTLFQAGTISNNIFKGSRTLVGFEKRSYLARVESGSLIPETERTKLLSKDRFLLLSILQESVEFKFVLTDIAGEGFRQAIEGESSSADLSIVKKATVVVIVVDGSRLANLSERIAAKAETTRLIKWLMEKQYTTIQTTLQIIVSKMDTVSKAPASYATIAFIDAMEQEFKKAFANQLKLLLFRRVSARKSKNSGLADLLSDWTRRNREVPTQTVPHILSSRQMGRFTK